MTGLLIRIVRFNWSQTQKVQVQGKYLSNLKLTIQLVHIKVHLCTVPRSSLHNDPMLIQWPSGTWQTTKLKFITQISNNKNIMSEQLYLRAGDLLTISHQKSFLAIDSLTQSTPKMKQNVDNAINALFLLTTPKCLNKSLAEQKPLTSYTDDPIYYNDPILLYHILSNKYLTCKPSSLSPTLSLSPTPTASKFCILPIYKCQTAITRRVRNTEKVVIGVGQNYGYEGYEGGEAMVVVRGDGRRGGDGYVIMKKNESSRIVLIRKNVYGMGNNISTLNTYQITNIETRKHLHVSTNPTTGSPYLSFSKSAHQFCSYLHIHTHPSPINRSPATPECTIQYNQLVYIHNWKYNKFIGVNLHGDVGLSDYAGEEGLFLFEGYVGGNFEEGSVVRLKHANSKKYICIGGSGEISLIDQPRLIDTCMVVKVGLEQLRLNVFINNANDIIKNELAAPNLSYRHRKNIFKVLKQLVSFIYGDFPMAEFLLMSQKPQIKLATSDQHLLANIGLINTLILMLKIFIDQILKQANEDELQKKDRSEEQTIIIYTLMSLVGICYRNTANAKIWINEMWGLGEAFLDVPGIVQSLFYLFKDCKEILLILEGSSYKVGKKEVPAMEYFVNLLPGKNIDTASKCKVLKLLEVFIIVNHKQKIPGHQAILFQALVESKLDSIMLPMRSNEHNDLLIQIPQKQTFTELEQLIIMRRTYEKQLELVKIQLELYCSLCLNSNTQCFMLVKKKIPEDMIHRYLKGSLQPDFKEVIMKLLIDIYLNNLSKKSHEVSKSFIIISKQKPADHQFSVVQDTNRQALLQQQGQQMVEYTQKTPSHSKALEDIQNLILDVTKNSIKNSLIDSSIYMNIKSLRRFLDLKILDKEEVQQFRLLLVEFIAKFSKQSFKENEKKKIVVEIIKIMNDYVDHEVQQISKEFIYFLKQERVDPQKVFDKFISFSHQFGFFNTSLQKQELSFLPKLIKESIEFNDSTIFIAASGLMKKLNERLSLFVNQLKDRIIIESKWSNDFYYRILKLKVQLNGEISSYISKKADKKQEEHIEQQLNQTIKQLNYLFFENSKSGRHEFSELTQNIYRQMNLLEIIVSFLNESQKKFKESFKNANDVYSTCFQFISLYLQDNRLNFIRFQQKYLDIKFVFEYPDKGQIKFLNNLIRMPNARDLMMDEIIDCIMLSFLNNKEPNPYTLLSLLNTINNPNLDKQRLEVLVQKIMKRPELFRAILKVSEKKGGGFAFVWSWKKDAENYHRDWILYAFFLFKLLVILLQQSSEKTNLSIEVENYISFQSLFDLLKNQDLLVTTSTESLEATLLKREIIKIFPKIYLSLLEKEKDEVLNILSFVHFTLQNLSYLKQDHAGAGSMILDEVLQKSSDHGNLIFESQIRTKTRANLKKFENNFNPIYISIVEYYPFITKILDTLMNSNPLIDSDQTLKKQSSIQFQSTFRKMKDFVQHRLSYAQFNKNNKQYQNAITNCEDIFKRKLGLNFSAEEKEKGEDNQNFEDIQMKDYFMNEKIENTVKCYKFDIENEEAQIYRSLISIFHSSKFTEYLVKETENLPVHLNLDEMQKVIEMLKRHVSEDHGRFCESVKLFNFFAKFNKQHCLRMSFSSSREFIMQILSDQKQDLGNYKLCVYLSFMKNMFLWEVQKDSKFTKKEQNYVPFKESFINRICKRVEVQKLLYSSNKFSEQAIAYAQNGNLCFERFQQHFTIQICLEWIRNMSVITEQKLKEAMYGKIFMQVVDLIKVYSNFIKEFNSKYMNSEMYNKINLCLQIVFHFISGITKKSIFVNYLIERQIWNDLNLILALDDGWAKNLDQLDDAQENIFVKIVRSQVHSNPRFFLKQAQKMYQNSKKQYGQIIPESYYPLLPMKSLFGEVKSNIIYILKEFKHFPLEIEQQIFSRIQMSVINRNIFEVYKKHNKMFNEYGIPSAQISIDYKQGNEWKDVAENIVLENGIDLTALKMHIGVISGSSEMKTEYDNLRLQMMNTKKIRSAFSTFFTFIKDFFLLFIFCFLSLCKKKKSRDRKDEMEIEEKKMLPILNFFLTKIGRIQISQNQPEILRVDFMIRPECVISKEVKHEFTKNINFVSMQLKLQSIYTQAVRFLLLFQNEIDFYRRWNKVVFVTFLTKNFDMITYLNFAVIVAQNIVLIANVNAKDTYFITTSLDQPFVWLQVISTILAGLIMVAYCIKDVHLLIKNINFTLKLRGESYGSNYNNYNSFIKLCIKVSMVLMDSVFAYHLIYTFILGMVFYNKLFVALLLLDIFFQIPTLKNLLMSIWRPKIQIILAIVSFVLVQYFFSIIMFFNFKDQTYGLCDTLGECFGFVFVTTYKTVGGFVGYLFIKSGDAINPVNFFQIFQDVYVVLVFQVFFALILAIIIDTFSLIRSEITVRQEYLDSCCIVCNLNKTRFNSSNISFKGHIAITHNIWNYFYYYEYIHHKPALKRTAYERQVYLTRNANWLPIDSSFDLAGEQGMNEERMGKAEVK